MSTAASATSLQLTLENSKLKEATDAYVKKLLPIVEGKTDVIGFAFAVNGQLNSADVYASHSLFQKFWPMLLKGSAVEAIAQGEKGKKYTAITGEKVQAFLADAEKGTATSKNVTKRVRLIERETKESLLFECRDNAEPAAAPIISNCYVIASATGRWSDVGLSSTYASDSWFMAGIATPVCLSISAYRCAVANLNDSRASAGSGCESTDPIAPHSDLFAF